MFGSPSEKKYRFLGMEWTVTTGGTGSPQNVLRGKGAGREAIIFDYSYHSRHAGRRRGGSGRRYGPVVTVFCLRLPGASLPDFILTPERVLTRMGWSILGMRDVNLEGSPAFSRDYLLCGPDEAAVRGLFEHGPADYFAQEKSWHLQGSGDWVALYHSEVPEEIRGRAPVTAVKTPEELPAFLEKAARIADLLTAAESVAARRAPAAAGAPRLDFAHQQPQTQARLERLARWITWIPAAMILVIFLMILWGFLSWLRQAQ